MPDAKMLTYADFRDLGEQTRWLWPGWIPFGHLTILAAAKGAGKTHVALDLMGRLLTGAREWPDGGECPSGMRVAYLDTEGRKTMIVERLLRAGVPLESMVYPFPDINRAPRLNFPQDQAAFVECVKASQADVVVIDSLLRAFAGDENSSRDTGEVLGWIQDTASALGVAIVVLHHVRKKPDLMQVDTVTIDRVRGSGAVTQYAASLIVVEPAGPLTDVKRLRVEISNLQTEPAPLGFRIDEEGVKWVPVPGQEKVMHAFDEAKAFLLEILAGGPVESVAIRDTAESRGLKMDTLRRAKTFLQVRVKKEGKVWTWGLPTVPSASSEGKEDGEDEEGRDAG